jgi:hypothetical protein
VRGRIAGVLALVVLLGLVGWQWRADQAEAAAHTLTPLEPSQVRRIDLAMPHLPDQHLHWRNGVWVQQDGRAADAGWAGELAALAETPVAEWRPLADFRPAAIGLEPPSAVLTLDGTRLEFGEMAALDRRRYVRVGNRVALVPAQALPRIPSAHATR